VVRILLVNTLIDNLITIEHLLTMTSGLEWDEWGTSYSNEQTDVIALCLDCDDPLPFKIIHLSRFTFCSLCHYNLGEQSRSRIRLHPQELGSIVVAQGAAYCRQGLDRQRHESGI